MTISATAPRGGIVEEIDGATYTLMLRCRDAIERFEDYASGDSLMFGKGPLVARINLRQKECTRHHCSCFGWWR